MLGSRELSSETYRLIRPKFELTSNIFLSVAQVDMSAKRSSVLIYTSLKVSVFKSFRPSHLPYTSILHFL